MIKIDDEYIINATESCYTLEKIGQVEDVNSKNYGNETRTIIRILHNIRKSFKRLHRSQNKKICIKKDDEYFPRINQ